MNANLQITNTPIFSAKTNNEEIKIEMSEVREIEMSESRSLKIKNHFERLKKKLRKRSGSIL